MIFGGVAVASVLGVPLGAAIGALAGWRAAFGAMGGLCLLAPGAERAVAAGPADDPLAARPALMAALHNPGLRRGVVITLSLVAAHFMAYTFVRPLLETRAGFAGDWIGPLLFAYGVAGVAGNFVAGLGAARRAAGAAGHRRRAGLVLTLHAWLGDRPLAAGVLLLAWGLAYGGVSVSLQLWMLRAAPDAVEPATAWFVSAFNLGIAAGSLLGVPTVDALGLRANLLLAASCLVPAIAALLCRVVAGMPRGAPPGRSAVSYNPAMARGRSARRHRNRYMSVIASQDVHVDTAKGRLYARRWDRPARPARPSCCSMTPWVAWRCGVIFPNSWPVKPAARSSPTTGWASACRTPIPPRWSGGSSKRKRTAISPACAMPWTSVPSSRSATAWAAAWPSMSPRAMPRIAAR